MRPPVILHAISSFEQETLEKVATPVITGLSPCVTEGGPLQLEITKSPDFWSILQRLHEHQEGAAIVFELMQNIVEFTPPVITADNYEAAVGLANDFASAGGIVTVKDLKREVSTRRSKPTKPAKHP